MVNLTLVTATGAEFVIESPNLRPGENGNETYFYNLISGQKNDFKLKVQDVLPKITTEIDDFSHIDENGCYVWTDNAIELFVKFLNNSRNFNEAFKEKFMSITDRFLQFNINKFNEYRESINDSTGLKLPEATEENVDEIRHKLAHDYSNALEIKEYKDLAERNADRKKRREEKKKQCTNQTEDSDDDSDDDDGEDSSDTEDSDCDMNDTDKLACAEWYRKMDRYYYRNIFVLLIPIIDLVSNPQENNEDENDEDDKSSSNKKEPQNVFIDFNSDAVREMQEYLEILGELIKIAEITCNDRSSHDDNLLDFLEKHRAGAMGNHISSTLTTRVFKDPPSHGSRSTLSFKLLYKMNNLHLMNTKFYNYVVNGDRTVPVDEIIDGLDKEFITNQYETLAEDEIEEKNHLGGINHEKIAKRLRDNVPTLVQDELDYWCETLNAIADFTDHTDYFNWLANMMMNKPQTGEMPELPPAEIIFPVVKAMVSMPINRQEQDEIADLPIFEDY